MADTCPLCRGTGQVEHSIEVEEVPAGWVMHPCASVDDAAVIRVTTSVPPEAGYWYHVPNAATFATPGGAG